MSTESEMGPSSRSLHGEAVQMAFFLQGALVAAASQFASEAHGALQQPVHVTQPVNDAGDVKPYFLVSLASGIVLQVTVAPA